MNTELTAPSRRYLLIADDFDRGIEFALTATEERAVSGGELRVVSGGETRIIQYTVLSGQTVELTAPTRNYLLIA